MTRSTRSRRARSFITGEKGLNRVRLYAHPRDGTLMLEYRDENGDKKRASLRHKDLDRGKAAAEALAAELRAGPRPTDLTLQTLFDMYRREITPHKKRSTQAHDLRAFTLFVRCWGSSAKVRELDRRDWDRFIQLRRTGELQPLGGVRTHAGVRDRVIEYDLRLLLAVCNWAESVRVAGRPILERNPFKSFPIPTESNPDRPIASEEDFRALREAAKTLGPQVELYLLLTHETGHRCSAVGRLRWSDVDLSDPNKATVRWRPEHDKIGMDHTIPISLEAAEALTQAKRRSARIGDGWVFESPTSPGDPVRRDLLRDWWLKLERTAGLPRVRRRGWHSLRRKFATDLKHDTPLADLCFLGGWKDPQTVLRCYMKPDEATMRGALAKRAARRAHG